MKKTLYFALRMFTVILVLLAVSSYYGEFISNVEAHDVSLIIGFLGIKNTVLDSNVIVEGAVFHITWECSGVFTIALFIALVVTIPSQSNRFRVYYIGVGSSLIYLLNIARILFAIIAYQYSGERLLYTIHYVVGPLLMYFSMLIIWGLAFKEALSKR